LPHLGSILPDRAYRAESPWLNPRQFQIALDNAKASSPFLEAAAVRGHVEAAFDLLTVALFQRS
jgi:hypothetical protein